MIQNNNILSVFYKSILNLKDLLFLCFLIILKYKFKGLIGLALYFFVSLLFYFFTRNFIEFHIENSNFIYNSGVIKKKSITIPLDKIATIDLTQDILLRILNLYKVKIDSGSTNLSKSDIIVYLNKNEAEKLKSNLLVNDTSIESYSDNNTINYHTISPKEIFQLSLTSNFIFVGLGIILTLFTFLMEFADNMSLNINSAINSSVNSINSQFIDNKPILYIVLLCILLFIVFVIISGGLATIKAFLKFYNYKVWKDNNFINIEYGLLNTKKYSIPISNINTITIKQSFLRRFFKLYSLEVSVIGYGDEVNEQAILYPIASYNDLSNLLKNLLPNYNIDITLTKANKNTILTFLLPAIVTNIILVLLSFMVSNGFYSLLITPFLYFLCLLRYKNAGLGLNNDTILISNGVFSKILTFIPFEKIDSVERIESYFLKKKNVCTYSIGFHSNLLLSLINAYYIDNRFYDAILKKLDY